MNKFAFICFAACAGFVVGASSRLVLPTSSPSNPTVQTGSESSIKMRLIEVSDDTNHICTLTPRGLHCSDLQGGSVRISTGPLWGAVEQRSGLYPRSPALRKQLRDQSRISHFRWETLACARNSDRAKLLALL